MYNKATAKCTHYKKSFYEAVNCWLLHLELAKVGWIPAITRQRLASVLNNQNVINFIGILSHFLLNPSATMSYKQNACNGSMLANASSFEAFDFIAEDVNNDLNFNKFMTNGKAVAHESSSYKSKDQSDAKKSAINYNANKYVIMRIPEKSQVELQISFCQTDSDLVKLLIRKNDHDRDENTGSHFLSKISEPLVATVNLLSTIPLADFTNPNWHISFMTLIDKKLLLSHMAMILPKTISTSRSFEYLKTLWHVDFSITDHICISRQRF